MGVGDDVATERVAVALKLDAAGAESEPVFHSWDERGGRIDLGSFNPAMLVHGEQSITLDGALPVARWWSPPAAPSIRRPVRPASPPGPRRSSGERRLRWRTGADYPGRRVRIWDLGDGAYAFQTTNQNADVVIDRGRFTLT